MEQNIKNPILLLFIIINLCYGREQLRQQGFNQNIDFLSHEISGNPTQPKRDYVAPVVTSPRTSGSTEVNKGIRDYVAPNPFPNSNPSQNTGFGQSNLATSVPKRDYVNPQYPTLKTPAFGNSGNLNQGIQNTASTAPKRDYVAPQLPTKNTPTAVNQNDFPPINGAQNNRVTSPKRDYFNPQFPSSSTQPANFNSNSQNKVKDLVNFYDRGGQSSTAKVPSYSSILTGTTKNDKYITPSPSGITPSNPTNKPPNKPLSFSDVLSGSNKPNAPLNPNAPTYVPKNPVSPGNKLPSTQPGSPAPKPGQVLPSSILNNKNSPTTNSNEPTDMELQTLSEELLRKDSNNAAKYVTISYQEKTTSQSKEDKASRPLFTVSDDVWNIPTIKKFVPLLDNYERDTLVNEYVTPQERNEENAFMDVIMATTVIRHLMTFLRDKGYVTPDPKQQRDFLKQLWFSLYSRGKGKISSSGFEHIFVSELKNGEISGLHNWIYFSKEETANRVNYLGYLKYLELNDKGSVLKLHFSQNDVDKPVNSMFVGTSPELEMAIYTLCFVTRADRDCSLKLGGKTVDIITHTFRYRSKNLIGSAYPQI